MKKIFYILIVAVPIMLLAAIGVRKRSDPVGNNITL